MLDLNPPSLDDLALIGHLRHLSAAPLLVLSPPPADLIPVRALALGADAYLIKPVGHLELLARIKALLRRVGPMEIDAGALTFQQGELRVDFARREVRLRGSVLRLTPTEYQLLSELVQRAGRVVPLADLVQPIWGLEVGTALDDLKTYISRLRRKLRDDPTHSRYILTERAVGYRFTSLDVGPTEGAIPLAAAVC